MIESRRHGSDEMRKSLKPRNNVRLAHIVRIVDFAVDNVKAKICKQCLCEMGAIAIQIVANHRVLIAVRVPLHLEVERRHGREREQVRIRRMPESGSDTLNKSGGSKRRNHIVLSVALRTKLHKNQLLSHVLVLVVNSLLEVDGRVHTRANPFEVLDN